MCESVTSTLPASHMLHQAPRQSKSADVVAEPATVASSSNLWKIRVNLSSTNLPSPPYTMLEMPALLSLKLILLATGLSDLAGIYQHLGKLGVFSALGEASSRAPGGGFYKARTRSEDGGGAHHYSLPPPARLPG